MAALIKRTLCVILTLSLLLVHHVAQSQDATLNNITVSNTRDDLLLYLNLEGAFTEDIRRAILSGVPTSFAFIVNLHQSRNLWFDQKIADIKVIHTIKYDNLKKDFTVVRSWKDSEIEMTKSFEEAQKLMSEINSLSIIPLGRLEKGRQYQLRTKAEVSKKTLPLNLHYVLFFVSLWDFETDWYTVDFTY